MLLETMVAGLIAHEMVVYQSRKEVQDLLFSEVIDSIRWEFPPEPTEDESNWKF